jgi:hypothetical protein
VRYGNATGQVGVVALGFGVFHPHQGIGRGALRRVFLLGVLDVAAIPSCTTPAQDPRATAPRAKVEVVAVRRPAVRRNGGPLPALELRAPWRAPVVASLFSRPVEEEPPRRERAGREGRHRERREQGSSVGAARPATSVVELVEEGPDFSRSAQGS